jgi:glycerol-3-phosphate acyltransferase PlsX
MGGDNAPSEVVKGAVQFAATGQGQVMLVGDPAALAQELEAYDASRLPIGVVPSEGVISEDESPALALRQKPRASILVSTGMVKQGHADASVTMGSTGAAMAAGAVVLGLAKGVERPALGGPVLGVAPNTCIVDLGANVDCRPRQLLSFGALGDVFARTFFGVDDPRIALLSVGAEAGKGNRQVRETTELFETSGLNFIGNIEANDLPKGVAEVVVCDGFVGNIVMKLTEGLGQELGSHLRSRLDGKVPSADLDLLLSELYDMSNVVESRGGGPLLGVNGVSVVGHGAARADAVERALATAKLAVETDFVTQMNRRLELLDSGLDD